MSQTPAASVVVPVLNGEATLGDTLIALKSQVGVPGPFEIIVVDNGSTDRSPEIALAHGVTLLRQPIRGPAAARNLGLAHACADVVVFTDADTVPTRRWLAALAAGCDGVEVVLATGPIHGWQPSTPAERFVCARRVFDPDKTTEHPLHPFAHGMNVAVRRQAALDIGGWDQMLTSGEDIDFALRLRKRFGKPIRYVEGAVLFHRHRSTDEALWRQARWHGAGYALFLRRHRDSMRWAPWQSGLVRTSILFLHGVAPIIEVARAARLISPERSEFERYYRRWTRHFWGGFFEQWGQRSV
jgi:glycosyltransferase involved in cell wall biosynthesis